MQVLRRFGGYPPQTPLMPTPSLPPRGSGAEPPVPGVRGKMEIEIGFGAFRRIFF